jgi:hypothetical protein
MTATPPANAPHPAPAFRFNPRVLALLALLTAMIAASVILTDRLSPRPRAGTNGTPQTGTGAAPQTGSAQGGQP